MWFSLTPIFLYFISFKYRSMFNFYKKKKKTEKKLEFFWNSIAEYDNLKLCFIKYWNRYEVVDNGN